MSSWLGEAAADGAELVLFPEAFVPCFPSTGCGAGGRRRPAVRETFARLLRDSVDVPGPADDRLGGVAREHGV